MPSLEDQLRALRASNVAHAEFHENGNPKVIDFFPPSDQPAQQAAPSGPYAGRVSKQPEVDLLTDVIMQPDRVPQLTEEDFPPDVIEAEPADDAEQPE